MLPKSLATVTLETTAVLSLLCACDPCSIVAPFVGIELIDLAVVPRG